MKKILSLAVFLSVLIFSSPITLAQVEPINPNLRITSPNAGTIIRPGQEFSVSVAMDQEAVGSVAEIVIELIKDNIILSQYKYIRFPQTSNQATFKILTLDYGEGPAVIMVRTPAVSSSRIGYFATQNIFMAKYRADLTITSPQAGASIDPRQPLNVGVSINQEAVGVIDRIVVSLRPNSAPTQVYGSTEINNPQSRSNVSIPIQRSLIGSNVTVEARVASRHFNNDNDFSGFVDQVSFSIQPINANVRITNVENNQIFYPGQTIQPTVTMNAEAAGFSSGLITEITMGGRTLVTERRDNPQASNVISLRIPPDISVGEAILQTWLDPGIRFMGMGDGKSIRIQRTQADVRITSPENNAEVRPGQNINLSININPNAVRMAESLRIRVLCGGGVYANTINRPQANNQTTVQIPAILKKLSDTCSIEALLLPETPFTNNRDQKTVRIASTNVNLQFKSPENNAVLHPGQNVRVATSISNDAVGIAQNVSIKLMKDGRVIEKRDISNPRASSELTFPIPLKIEEGSYYFYAEISPVNFLTNCVASRNVQVQRKK